MTLDATTAARPTALDPRDALGLDALLTEDELALRRRVRGYVEERFAPRVRELFEEGTFPREIARELGGSGCSGCTCTATAARGRARSSTGSPASSSRRGTPACARSPPCRAPSR